MDMKEETVHMLVTVKIRYCCKAGRDGAIREMRDNLGVSICTFGPTSFSAESGRVVLHNGSKKK